MADAALALNQVLHSVETLEVDEKPKQEDANSDSCGSSNVQVTSFTDLVDDVTLHFQIIRLPNQIYAWIGCNSSKLGRMYAAAPTRPSNSVSVSSILGGVSDNTGAGIARRLGVVRFISDVPPTHYKLKIQLFSLLVKNAVEKYESAEFEAGGFKWKLVLYPNGNKRKNVNDHISSCLTLADTSSLCLGWEVCAIIRLFLLDQKKDNYLVVQDAIGKESHFHELKLECGFDHFVPLNAFNDASNGYLVEDKCVFGTEVFVTKERGRVKAECLSMIKDTSSVKYVWKIENFSKLDKSYYYSEVFSAGGHKWKIQLYPKGFSQPSGNHLSLYLFLVDVTPDSKVYIDYTFRILNQLKASHIAFKASRCYTASSNGWGWHKFVALDHLNDAGNGCLVKDVCLVEAEVNVWGCQGSTKD